MINKCEPFIHSFKMRKHFYKTSLTLHSRMLSYLFPSSLFPFDLSWRSRRDKKGEKEENKMIDKVEKESEKKNLYLF